MCAARWSSVQFAELFVCFNYVCKKKKDTSVLTFDMRCTEFERQVPKNATQTGFSVVMNFRENPAWANLS